MAKKLLLLGLLALTDAASISYPARSNLDFNFNNFGFKVRAVNKPTLCFKMHFPLLKTPSSAFTIKNLFRHYGKQAFEQAVSRHEIGMLTQRS